MQCTHFTLKQMLYDNAKEMSSGVGNINTQFLTFKTDIQDRKSLWNKVLAENTVGGYTRKYMTLMLRPQDQSEKSQQKRVDRAEIIYSIMKGYEFKEELWEENY